MISIKCEASADVSFRQRGEVFEDLGLGHASGKIIQRVVDGDAQAANAGLAAALAKFNRDDLRVVHACSG
jgi:hypothetical protein